MTRRRKKSLSESWFGHSLVSEGEWREFKEWSLRHWKVYSTKYPGLSDQELIGKMKDAWCALKRKQTPLQK